MPKERRHLPSRIADLRGLAPSLRELSEQDLIQAKWPNAPLDAIHECYIHNADE